MRCVTDVLPVIRTRFGGGSTAQTAQMESHSFPKVGRNVTPHTPQGMHGAIARKIELGIFGRAAPPSGLTLGSGGSPGGHPLTRLVPGGCASCIEGTEGNKGQTSISRASSPSGVSTCPGGPPKGAPVALDTPGGGESCKGEGKSSEQCVRSNALKKLLKQSWHLP